MKRLFFIIITSVVVFICFFITLRFLDIYNNKNKINIKEEDKLSQVVIDAFGAISSRDYKKAEKYFNENFKSGNKTLFQCVIEELRGEKIKEIEIIEVSPRDKNRFIMGNNSDHVKFNIYMENGDILSRTVELSPNMQITQFYSLKENNSAN